MSPKKQIANLLKVVATKRRNEELDDSHESPAPRLTRLEGKDTVSGSAGELSDATLKTVTRQFLNVHTRQSFVPVRQNRPDNWLLILMLRAPVRAPRRQRRLPCRQHLAYVRQRASAGARGPSDKRTRGSGNLPRRNVAASRT